MVELGPVTDRWENEKQLCKAWFQPGLTDEDREWLRHHFELFGQQPPDHDISWIEMEWVR